MRKLFTLVLALIGASSPPSARDVCSIPVHKAATADTVIECAEELGSSGETIKARVVYDLILRAFTRAGDEGEVLRACESLVNHVSPDAIVKLNAPYWSCPIPMLDAWLGDVHRIAIEEPILVHSQPPAFPHHATNLEGFIDVKFHIEVDGSVSNVTIVRSTNEIFEQSVVDAVSKWKYRPAYEYGKAEPRHNVMQRFSFEWGECHLTMRCTCRPSQPLDVSYHASCSLFHTCFCNSRARYLVHLA
ncbi:MAG: TonB family protein [Proteobacteria bacterium]|nr:TonB family protein [Pseudomonadota bacterium]